VTRETDAVVYVRRETWRKAHAALVTYSRCLRSSEARDILAGAMVELRDAARADGVTFDETSP